MSGKRIHGTEAAGAGDLGVIDDSNADVLGPCPSCGATLRIGAAVDPRTGKPASMLLHAMPFCSYFGKTDPDDIVKAMLTP